MHQCRMSGEVLPSQTGNSSATSCVNSPPGPKNSPVKELVIMSKCACVFQIYVDAFIMGWCLQPLLIFGQI